MTLNRPELLWPGKDLLREPSGLPFQLVECFGGGAEDDLPSQRVQDLFPVRPHVAWRNKLIWGDNLTAMASLRSALLGEIDLIYPDPPFGTGDDFSADVEVGDSDQTTAKKKPTIIEELAYRDTWRGGVSTYLSALLPRLRLMRDLLKPTGSIYLHLDSHLVHYVKLLMDEVFGPECFRRQIIWRIGWASGLKTRPNNWIRNHDTILYYTKSPTDYTFTKQFLPSAKDGRPKPIEDVWNATPEEFKLKGAESFDSIQIKSWSTEKTGYPTQKNESIIRRILASSSREGELVADFFCGGGTTLAVAEQMGRRWIGCDLGRFAIHVTRKRLLEIAGLRPFEVLNCGNYERQLWQSNRSESAPATLRSYIEFVLSLYDAQPFEGVHIHGKRGKALVTVGPVDSPVMASQVEDAIQEAASFSASELHVLGWEWEMGIESLRRRAETEQGVALRLVSIPAEAIRGKAPDVRFYELGHLRVGTQAMSADRRKVRVTVQDFVSAVTENEPPALRGRPWQDYIDFWAVDRTSDSSTFTPTSIHYRTKEDRSLVLQSDYDYPDSMPRRIRVKVIDVFGNDTSTTVNWGTSP